MERPALPAAAAALAAVIGAAAESSGGGGAGAPASAPLVAVIPLHGQVGGTIDGRAAGTFDAEALRECFREAQARGAGMVVLDVDSPGGLVSEMESICETIIGWHDRLRVVSHPRDALSAAAVIAMSCREIVVRPESRIGAAVIVQSDDAGRTSAVEAKQASVHHARQRRYMAASAQPYAVVEAMTVQEARLWWSHRGGFSAEPPPPGREHEWTRVDGETSVLTLTGNEALEWGLADAAAPTAGSAAMALGLTTGEVTVIDLGGVIEGHNRALDAALEALRRDLDECVAALRATARGLSALAEAARLGDQLGIAQARAAVGLHRAAALAAAGRIRATDRAILARRLGACEDVAARIAADARLIEPLGALPQHLDPDDLDRMARRFNEAVRRWQALLAE